MSDQPHLCNWPPVRILNTKAWVSFPGWQCSICIVTCPCRLHGDGALPHMPLPFAHSNLYFFFFAIINRNCEHNIFSSSWALLVSHWTRGWSGRNLHWTSHHAVHTYEAWMQGTDALRSCYSYITFVTTVLVSSGCCNKSTIDWMA